MDETDTESAEQLTRRLAPVLLVMIGMLAVLALLTLVDVQIKRAIVEQAERFRRDMENASGQQRGAAQQPASPRVPTPVRRIPDLGDVAPDTGPQAADSPVEAPSIVRPGDESARPPHRGSVNGP